MRQAAIDDTNHADIHGGDMGTGTWRVPNHSGRARGMDPATRKLGLIALGVSLVVAAGIGLWSVAGPRNAVVPVIEADSRPIRVKPENPGGLQVSGTNDEIMSGDAGPTGSRLAPPPETPEPKMLRARQQDPPTAQMASVANVAVAIPPAGIPLVGIPLAGAAPATEAPSAIAGSAEKRTAAKPVSTPSSQPPISQSGATNGTLVQFAALATEEAARAEWAQLNQRIPDLLGGHQPSFSRTERDGKVYWRVRTGGFADMAQATSFCQRARAKGAACAIASF